jgi:uncharacterized protein involved in outer membrane biogenesis
MDVLSLYPGLLLGALSLVILCVVVSVVVIAFGIDRSLKAMTRQLERDLQRVFDELDKTNFEIRLLKEITLSSEEITLSSEEITLIESSKSSDNPD